MYSQYKSVIVTIEDNVATVAINRPEMGNAFSEELYAEYPEVMARLSDDDNVRAVVVTGKGKFFCAGGDIVNMKQKLDAGEYGTYTDVTKACLLGTATKRCLKPVIAMVNGAAAGGGAGLALSCDFRVMTPKSQIKMAFIGLGFPGDTGSAYFMTKLVGAGKALEMMMLGEPLYGEEAARLNVARLAPEGQLEEETYKFARRLAQGPTQGYKWQKKLFLDVIYGDLTKSMDLESAGMAACARSADYREAVNAFLEKRRPVFTGK